MSLLSASEDFLQGFIYATDFSNIQNLAVYNDCYQEPVLQKSHFIEKCLMKYLGRF